jgi:hypothetical protein
MASCPEEPEAIFEFLVDVYIKEEEKVVQQLREQFEMDAAEFHGIATFGQFQTLAMFSPRRLDVHEYAEMMTETMRRSKSRAISFKELMEAMHEWEMLVPFSFDRFIFDFAKAPFAVAFMESELEFRRPQIDTVMTKLRKLDETIHTQVMAAKNKLDQQLAAKRGSPLLETAHREFYGLLYAVVVE